MAKVVDEQNRNDEKYIPMSDNKNSIALKRQKNLFLMELINRQVIQNQYCTKED